MAVLWAAFVAPSTAFAAQDVGPNGRPRAPAARIETSEAPIIDGDLSDPGWAKATVLDQFLQRQPNSGDPPSQRTVLRIMYDQNNLYFGVYAYDTEPEQIVVRGMQRDGDIFTGDLISIILDPGLSRRNAYLFQVGPSGGRFDALRLNNTEELVQWDTIWQGRARIVEDGWIAEVAVPFRSISYVEGQSDWGFEFGRNIRRRNEGVRWSSINQALSFADVSEAGTLTGITNIQQGLGLDLQIYGVVRSEHDWSLADDGWGITATAGGNAFYKITPALTGTLTFNPDFSDAPLDAREVNTTRFSLFVPETRDFFLQDAAAFEFGGRGFTRAFADRTANNGRPFFSRNIGLVRGVPVSIIGGGKLSGTFADVGIGALSVYTDDTPTASGQLLSVARLTYPILEQSRLGMIVTNGDPTGLTDNTVVGGDFQYRTADFLGSEVLQSDIYYEHSSSSTLGDDAAFGGVIAYPNEPWAGDISFKQVGADFSPALGFVNRTAIRVYDGSVTHRVRYREGSFRHLGIITRHIVVTDLDDRLESRESRVSLDGETSQNNTFSLDAKSFFEAVPATFNLPGGIPVLPGRYNWGTIGGFFQISQARALSGRLTMNCCGFYDGTKFDSILQVNFRPNAYYEIETRYEFNALRLPRGDVDIHLASVEATVNFTPDMQVAVQAQFDNISDSFGFLARYRWEFLPGSEFLVALGQSAVIPGTDFEFQTTQLSIRLGHTFRF